MGRDPTRKPLRDNGNHEPETYASGVANRLRRTRHRRLLAVCRHARARLERTSLGLPGANADATGDSVRITRGRTTGGRDAYSSAIRNTMGRNTSAGDDCRYSYTYSHAGFADVSSTTAGARARKTEAAVGPAREPDLAAAANGYNAAGATLPDLRSRQRGSGD